jgi:hypothetical protein
MTRYYYENKERLSAQCKQRRASDSSCYKKYRKEYERHRSTGAEGKLFAMMGSARKRAKKKNIEFNLTIDVMRALYTSHCLITGDPLNWETHNGFSPESPSLDRTNPSKGYTADNVRIISHKANTWKSNMSLEDALKVVEYLQSLDSCGDED